MLTPRIQNQGYKPRYKRKEYGTFDIEKEMLGQETQPPMPTETALAQAQAPAGMNQLQPAGLPKIPDFKNAVVGEALKYKGTPYKWGGNTVKSGLDCSGYNRLVFKNLGVNLPRTAREQARVGAPVASSAMQPGDMVFFQKGGKPVHHTGIYVGDGKFIHAPKTGDVVKISNLGERSDFIGARRVF